MRKLWWLVLIGLAVVFVMPTLFVSAEPSQAPSQLQACSHIFTTNLASWDMTNTRTEGHNEIVAGGLHVYTDSNSSQAKAAGYHSLDVQLSSITSTSLVYTTSVGSIDPGLQIVVDFDGNGSVDGTLVAEAVYGGNVWLSNASSASSQFVKDGAPHIGGGNGSNWWGTLTEWSAAFPSAQVKAIGYSLGSGVLGDGVIQEMDFGCNTFTFGLPGTTAPEIARPEGSFTCRATVGLFLYGPLYAQRLSGSNWLAWDGYINEDPNKPEGIEVALHNNAGETGEFQYYRIVSENGAHLTYFERIQPGVCVEIADPTPSQ